MSFLTIKLWEIMNIKKITKTALTFVSVFLISICSVSAEETTVENAFSECGIGAAIFKNNETGAIISNIIWDLGTTALSSQTSSPSSCQGAKKTAAAFIDKTQPVLEEQFVKGDGAHVAALLDILDCENDVRSIVIERVQNDLAVKLKSDTYVLADQRAKSVQISKLIDSATASVCVA